LLGVFPRHISYAQFLIIEGSSCVATQNIFVKRQSSDVVTNRITGKIIKIKKKISFPFLDVNYNSYNRGTPGDHKIHNTRGYGI